MLTDVEIRKAEPRESAYDLTDGDGLELRVHPSGAKAWRFSYRLHGRRRRVPLGRYPDVKLGAARREAAILRGRVARGEDPAAERTKAKEGATMADLFARYIEEHAEPKKKPASVRMDRMNWQNHAAPVLGRKLVDAVTHAEIAALHHAIGKKTIRAKDPKTGKKTTRHTKGAANRTLALLSKMFSLAERWGMRQQGSNPCKGVEKFKERRMERFLSPAERKRLDAALDAAEKAGPRAPGGLGSGAITAIRLLSLTGARLGEIVGLEWPMVDLHARCLRIPDELSKTGRKVVPLSTPAVELLERLHEAHDASIPWVCVGEKGGKLQNLQRSWRKVRARAGLDDVRIHDLRHSAASDALNSGVPLALVGAMLGHRSVLTTQRYAHVADKALREAVETMGAAIERATKGER